MEIVSNFPADAALTPRKKRGFSVCSVAGSRSRDYQSNPHFQCGIALKFVNSPHQALFGSFASFKTVQPLVKESVTFFYHGGAAPESGGVVRRGIGRQGKVRGIACSLQRRIERT